MPPRETYRLEVRGLAGVLRRSQRMGDRAAGASFDMVVRVANTAVNDVKGQLYPGHGLVTGNLRRSVSMRPDRARREVRVGTNVFYAPFVEGAPMGAPRRGRFRGYQMFWQTMQKVPRWLVEEARKLMADLQAGP